MAPPRTPPLAAIEQYFTDLRKIRASGGGTDERSYYTPLINLLNDVGRTLKPKVFCINELVDQGAGHPDIGLYASQQVSKGRRRKGQLPERGVMEVKSASDDAWVTADGAQVSKYWDKYRLVLVTNTRDFLLLGEDGSSGPVKMETFRLAESAEEFESRLDQPRTFARDVGTAFGEYLCRALAHRAALVEPKDLAWLLASYARDALTRVEVREDESALKAVREALEQALGVHFRDAEGAAFFRSTLVQTLFYGVFSGWVLWARQDPEPTGSFNWREAVWHLRVPVLRTLFQQLSDPGRLQPLGLVEVMDWTGAALDRVDREAFFKRFNEGEAVPYFYEPFLEEFDPKLRKQLGVWYTPIEIVRYMVARVDRALKDDLGIAEGLAADNVYVLDPCCGTGAYLSEVLRRIDANLREQGKGSLTGALVKKAAMERVFGFEIMPAPFVVAHLQVGLALQALDAPFSDDETERAGVYLTNALTGWESKPQKALPFPGLEEERDRADNVKQEKPVLVILGNPPYNGFAGVAVDEERELTEAYRTTKNVQKPDGQGLNDLYVRFFRMAERRIAEKTGRGVICFISNYSWLDGLSFTGMRERYLEAFDVIRVDSLNGDKYKTGKTTPEGDPDPSIFSTAKDPVGIQLGTAIATLVRKAQHEPSKTLEFRNLWGQTKREQLIETSDGYAAAIYQELEPLLPLSLPFSPTAVSDGWFEWPSLPELLQSYFAGVQSKRDLFLTDIDLEPLKQRVGWYFDPAVSDEEVARLCAVAMKSSSGFAVPGAHAVRSALLTRGGPNAEGFVRFAYRPFDTRWLYWDEGTGLLGRPSPDYKPHAIDGHLCIVSQKKPRREWSPPQVISALGCLDLMDRGASCIPLWLTDSGLGIGSNSDRRRQNLSATAERYLDSLGLGLEDLFHHVLATLHDPVYRKANAGALRMDWPRIPLPGWPDGTADGAADELAASSARGRKLAALLDVDADVPGVSTGALRPELAVIGVPATVDADNMSGVDFALNAGWGHFGAGDAVMPGQGRAEERPFTPVELAPLGGNAVTLGQTTFDIHLNDRAYWRNVPAAVWSYKLGGYQVLKKWLSYRERKVLGRPLRPEEVQHFTDTARRIAAILLLTHPEPTVHTQV